MQLGGAYASSGVMKWLAGGVAGLILVSSAALAAPPSINEAYDKAASGIRADIMASPEAALRGADALRHEALQIAVEPRRAWALAIADQLAAEALLSLDRARDARSVSARGLAVIRAASKDTEIEGKLVLAHGGAAAQIGRIEDALRDYQKAYRIFVKNNAAREQAIALLDIATIYFEAADYRNALKYEQQSIEAHSDDPALLVSIYNNRGIALTELGQFDEAAKEYRQALVAASKMNSLLLETRILQNLARAQSDSLDYVGAEATLERAFKVAASGPAASWRPALNGVAAQIALQRNQLDRAAELITRTFTGARGAQATMPMIDFHKTAYSIFRARGENAKALTHLEAFKKLDDEKRALAASANAALMSAQFDFANQDLKISQLQRGEAERDATIARARARSLVMLLAAAGVISMLLLIGFFSIRRSRNEVRAANDSLRVTNSELGKALAAKTEFLATTSHEIRTPLNGILGMTQVMLADKTVAPDLRGRIELVHGAGETMRALVDDILDVAKIETGELRIHPADMDLKRLLQDAATVWSGQAETKQIGLELDSVEAPSGIVADEVRLRQIVFNLMSNAIKFTDRGQVRLSARVEQKNAGERLVIDVTDSGVGIPPDRLEEIFESFRQVDGGTTRRHGGTGLGLTICRSIAQAMGGNVRVASMLGTGSTFTVDLPLVRADLPGLAPAEARGEIGTLSAAEMLLIEANPLSQGVLRALLTPAVTRLAIVSDVGAAEQLLDGADHVLADAGAFALDIATASDFASTLVQSGRRVSMLWPAPDASVVEVMQRNGVQLIAKPITAPDLLAALQMGYGAAGESRELAA